MGVSRRGPSLQDRPVTYGAVGASLAPDLLRYPPRRYRAFEHRGRIGFGEARWQYAWHELMTWGVQRRSGCRVRELPAASVVAHHYTPVGFDTASIPVRPAGWSADAAGSGASAGHLRPGDGIVLEVPVGPVWFPAPARVIQVIEERLRRGFAYGTLPGHPESGEEAFLLERESDDSVWLTVRGFSRPGGFRWWLVAPALLVMQQLMIGRYLRALAGPIR